MFVAAKITWSLTCIRPADAAAAAAAAAARSAATAGDAATAGGAAVAGVAAVAGGAAAGKRLIYFCRKSAANAVAYAAAEMLRREHRWQSI